MKTILLRDLDALAEFANQLIDVLRDQPAVIYLAGELGAGKTAMVRAIFVAGGMDLAVKSPSYTLLEPYRLCGRDAWHLDLYRLADPEEIETLGIRDFDPADAYLFVEWPEHGKGHLPAPDIRFDIDFAAVGRRINLEACSGVGEQILSQLTL